MLVLSRKEFEGILIGQDIKLVVLEIRDDSVRLGLDAPREVLILRDEVARRVAGGNLTDSRELAKT